MAFKMKTRPKKPTRPSTIYYDVGCYVTLGYLLECIDNFKEENPGRSDREIMLSVEDTSWDGNSINLTVPPQSQREYEAKCEQYKEDLKDYKVWQNLHTKEIAKHKATQKKRAAKTKLKRTQERLEKEMAAVKAKLEKA